MLAACFLDPMKRPQKRWAEYEKFFQIFPMRTENNKTNIESRRQNVLYAQHKATSRRSRDSQVPAKKRNGATILL